MNSSIAHSQSELTQCDDPLRANFEQIEAAVQETERGRWFLREFSRRQRALDTAELLTALERLTRRVTAYESFLAQSLRGAGKGDEAPQAPYGFGVAEDAPPASPRPRGDLSERLVALREIDALDVAAKVKLFA